MAIKIIITDDDISVHEVTKLTLNNYTFYGYPLLLINTTNSEDTKQALRDNPDAAMILLDVVMEENQSGLKLVDFIRNELHNEKIRIILRTGQPGMIPEKHVVEKYDINDYKEKTDMTFQKLITVIHSGIKAWWDICRRQETNSALEIINSVMFQLTEVITEEKFFQIITEGFDELSSIFQLPVVSPSGILPESIPGVKELIRKSPDLQSYLYRKRITISDHPRLFTNFFQSVHSAYINLQTQLSLKEKLRENQLFLRELHHRVKNNLQLISSTLRLDTEKIDDPVSLKLIRKNQRRIEVISLIHEKIYLSSDMKSVSFHNYIRDLTEEYRSLTPHINYTLHIPPEINLSIRQAIPLGIITDEIICNARKYAFEESGNIYITALMDKKTLTIEVKDDGKGFSANNSNKEEHTGISLIELLLKQLGGDMEYSGESGTRYSLTIPLNPV